MAVRLKDIAEDLGVSLVTVSKVLRDKPGVGETTRKRVLKRVKELNYRPNMLARSLASGQSCSVGLIVPDLVHSFFAEVARGASAVLRRESYQLFLASAEERPELEQQEMEHLLARGVDALIIASCQNNIGGFKSLLKSKTPYVLVDRYIQKLSGSFVGTDDIAVGSMATEHLIGLGRKRIAHIGGEQISTSIERLNGYKNALEANGQPIRRELVALRAGLEEAGIETGIRAMSDLLRLRKHPDAVFCYNDLTAVGAIRCLRANRLRVPEDVAVIGCGNLRLSEYLEVPLSTVDQSARQQGEEAAILALSLIARERKPRGRHLLIPPKLIARESTIGCEHDSN